MDLKVFIDQVKAFLIEFEDTVSKQETYNWFINESNKYNLTEEDFYGQVLKPAYKSINWDEIEKAKKEKRNIVATENKKEENNVPIDELLLLLRNWFNQGIIIGYHEIESYYVKAVQLKLSEDQSSALINQFLETSNYQPLQQIQGHTVKERISSVEWRKAQAAAPAAVLQEKKPVNNKSSKAILILSVLVAALLFTLLFNQNRSSSRETDMRPVIMDSGSNKNNVKINTVKQKKTGKTRTVNNQIKVSESDDVKLLKIVNEYFQYDNNNDIKSKLTFFSYPVDDFYKTEYLTREQLEQRMRDDQIQDPAYHFIEVMSKKIYPQRTGNGLELSLRIRYSSKTSEEEEWLKQDIALLIIFDDKYMIKNINETGREIVTE